MSGFSPKIHRRHRGAERTLAGRGRAAFTLIEIMVSIMIFTVVGGAMMGILFLATDLYRRGEAGRSANDEAVAVLAALDADVSRMVPFSDGGFLISSVEDASGNTLIAFKTVARDRSGISETGTGTRSIVAWWVDGEALRRAEAPAPVDDADPMTDEDDAALSAMLANPGSWPVITTGCLHFGASLSPDADARQAPGNWTAASGVLWPTSGTEFHHGGTGTDPAPLSLLLTVGLTGGGRFAPTGFVVDDSGSTIRIAGLKGVPTIPGSLLRIGDEWVGYGGASNGTLSDVVRAQRRSTQANHARNTPVRLAQTYSLARSLAR